MIQSKLRTKLSSLLIFFQIVSVLSGFLIFQPGIAEAASLRPSADAGVDSYSPDTTFDNMNGTYQLAIHEDPARTKRAFLRFDLTNTDSNIGSAMLSVTAQPNSSSVSVSVYAVSDDSWSETPGSVEGITWNNQPTYGALIGTLTLPPQAANTYVKYNVDITGYIRQEQAGDGMASLVLIGEADFKNIYSKESTVSSRKPSLEITPDTAAPLFQSTEVSDGFRQITLQYDENLMEQTAGSLKSNVLLSLDGTVFSPLGDGDTVSIVGSKVVVTLSSPLQGGMNKIKILANSLKDLYNNIKTSESITDNLIGQEDLNPAVFLGASVDTDGEGLTLNFNKDVAWNVGDAASNKSNFKLSVDGGSTYQDLDAGDSLTIGDNKVRISLASPMVGSGYVIKILAHTLKASVNSLPLDSETISASMTGRTYNKVVSATADAHVNSGVNNLEANYGSQSIMELKEGGGAFNRRIYLKFDLNGIGKINSAILRLYFPNANLQSHPLELYAVTDDSWTESGITYSNKPNSSTVISRINVGGENGWYQWNVADYVLEQLAGDGIVSLMLMGTNTSANRTVSSKESGVNGPQLVLDYDVAAPQLLQTQVSSENKVISLSFNESIQAHMADLNVLKAAITLARDGSAYTQLDTGDAVHIQGSTLTVNLENRLAAPGAQIRIQENVITDWIGNRITSQLTADHLDYDAMPPVMNRTAQLDAANKEIQISSDEALYNNFINLEQLKAAITYAADGASFVPLSNDDSVTILGGKLVILLANQLQGGTNKIRVAPHSFRDSSGNVLNEEYTTEAIAADVSAPQLQSVYPVNLNKKVVLVFDEDIVIATGNEDAFKGEVQISTNGGAAYRKLGSEDSVQVSGNMITVSLAVPLTGTANRIHLPAGRIQDRVHNILSSAVDTADFAASDTTYPYATPSELTLERAWIDSANIVFGNKDAAQGSFSELIGTKSFEAIVQSVLSGNRDPKLIERCVEIIKKMLTHAVNMPNLQGGLDSRGQSSMVSSIALVWNDQEIMSHFSDAEKSKLITFFKAALISTAFTSSEYDQHGNKRSGSRLAMNGDPNTWTGNPNYWEPNMTLLYAPAFVLGTENIKAILRNYNHIAFIKELNEQGLTSIESSFATTTGFGSLAAKAEMVEGIVRSNLLNIKGLTMDEFVANPMKLHAKTQEMTWDRYAEDGDFMGQMGMEHEFDSSDADGPRESATYALLGIDPSLQNRLLMDYFGYWNAPGNEVMRDQIDKLQKVGVSDYYAKTINGYYSQSRGGTKTEHVTADIYMIDTLISTGGLNPAAFHESFDYKDVYSAVTDEWILAGGSWNVDQEVIIPYNIKNPLTKAPGAVAFDAEERILKEASGKSAVAYTKKSFTNVSYLAWLRYDMPGEIGILGRVQDTDSYYLLTYTDGILAIKKKWKGSIQTLIQKPFTMNLGVSYRFRGVFTGDDIELYVNGSRELATQDKAIASGGIGVISNQANGKFDGILVQHTSMPAPVLDSLKIGDQQISLKFSSVEGALYYNVRYGTSPGSYSHTVKTISTSPVFKGLSNDTRYYFTVSAIGTLGESHHSNELSMIPRKTTAVAPKLKSLIADGNNIIVDFTTNPINQSYVIQYGTDSGSYTYHIEGVTKSPYMIPAAVSQMVNYVTVVPINDNGPGAASNEMSVIPNGTMLMQDDFNDGDYMKDWLLSAGAFTVDTTNGVYRLKTNGNDPDRLFVAQGFSWRDYTISVKMEFPNPFASTGEQYVLGRVKDYNNYYLVGYKYDLVQNKELIYIRKKVGGATTVVKQKEFAIDPKVEHALKVSFEGSTIQLYMDGILVLEANDTDLTVGTAGILSGKSIAYYDDFKVELLNGLEIPTIGKINGSSDGKASIAFSEVPSAKGYRIKYGERTHEYTNQLTVEGYSDAYEITGLKDGATYYFTVNAYNDNLESVNAEEKATILPKRDDDYQGETGNGGVSQPIGVPTPQIRDGVIDLPISTRDQDGTSASEVSMAAIEQAISGVKEADRKAVFINIPMVDGASRITVTLPASALYAAQASQIEGIQMNMGMAVVTIPPGVLGDRPITSSSKLMLSVEALSKSDLTDNVIRMVGDKAVYDFNLYVDGEPITQFERNAPIRVSFIYQMSAGEKAHQIVIYHIEDDGSLKIVKNSKYDSSTGEAVFTTHHFSKYSALYSNVTFNDLNDAEWARDSIEALAAREIVDGVGQNMFVPGDHVTRAQFIQMLMHAFDLVDLSAVSSFMDVQADAWYFHTISSAQKLGIIQGYPDGSFGADQKITREEMAAIAYRTSKIAQVNLKKGVQYTDFSDTQDIAQYAKESISILEMSGIINGMEDNRFAPRENTTRAQAAKVVYELLLVE